MAKKTSLKVDAMKAAKAKLISDADFNLWFGAILEELCAYEQGFRKVDEYCQGIRAAGSFMMHSLAEVDGGAEMLGRLAAKHYGFGKHKKGDQE